MTTARQHAASENGRPDFLSEFQKLNPDLSESRHRQCKNLWSLLTTRHREEPGCCYGDSSLDEYRGCFLDHREEWRDTPSGLPVIVAHPYCSHSPCSHTRDGENRTDSHQLFANKLADRGLRYMVSNASWYYPDCAKLVVIARDDVIDRIQLPFDLEDLETFEELQPKGPRVVEVDWEMIGARKLAEEGVVRNRRARRAVEEERNENYQAALNWYCDVAHTDRLAGFHRLAREQLAEAKRVSDAHPELQKDFLYFTNQRDRELVCGKPEPSLSRSELQSRLRAVPIPEGWGPFSVRDRDSASAVILDETRVWGYAQITQGGNLRFWGASLESLDGPTLYTVANSDPQSAYSSHNYACCSPEDAVAAAVDMWRRYDELTKSC